jgi:hypothetical protein
LLERSYANNHIATRPYHGSVQFGRNVILGRYDGLLVEALDKATTLTAFCSTIA